MTMKNLGRLLAVTAGFTVYFLAIFIILGWIVSLILTSVNHGSGASLIFTARTLLPLVVILGVTVLLYRVIKRSPLKRGSTTPKKDVR